VKRVIVLAFLAVLASAPAMAERPPYRFEFNLGAFVPTMDTQIRLDSTDGNLGVEVDFEDNLNLENSKVVPLGQADFWVAKKHGLTFLYFDLSRQSSGPSNITFRLGDTEFPADLPLSVRFDTKVLALTYSYKFFNNEKRSFGFNIGFNVNEISLEIASLEDTVALDESAEATAPLPTIGVNGHVMLSKKWRFYGTLGLFALSYDQYDGVLTSLSGGFLHQTFKNVGFGVGYYGFNIGIDSENEKLLGSVKYGYNGVVGYLNLRFR
jgi:hypothetical protein